MLATSRFLPCLGLFLLLLVPHTLAAADCAPLEPQAANGTTAATTMKFVDSNNALGNHLSAAVSSWNGTCGGEDIPNLTTSGTTANYNINISFQSGNRPADPSGEDQGCGNATVNYDSSGGFLGASITIWQNQTNGTSCSGALTAVLAHEIGHVLGLGHATTDTCKNSLMYNKKLDPNARPTSGHCNNLDSLWTTPDDPVDVDKDHPCRWQVA